ncbi:MAG: hypothetical protein JRC53_01115 [Deltaproteobacteria bacterium]|nr:hypothetical protein [Deltaproteobacteria bacterium]
MRKADKDKSSDKKIPMTISLTPGMNSKLIAFADKKRRTRAGMARMIIEDHFSRKPKRPVA